MREQYESVKEAITNAASNPKVQLTTGVAAPIATSTASQLDIISGWMSVISMGLGICTGAVMLATSLLRLSREWRDSRKRKR